MRIPPSSQGRPTKIPAASETGAPNGALRMLSSFRERLQPLPPLPLSATGVPEKAADVAYQAFEAVEAFEASEAEMVTNMLSVPHAGGALLSPTKSASAANSPYRASGLHFRSSDQRPQTCCNGSLEKAGYQYYPDCPECLWCYFQTWNNRLTPSSDEGHENGLLDLRLTFIEFIVAFIMAFIVIYGKRVTIAANFFPKNCHVGLGDIC